MLSCRDAPSNFAYTITGSHQQLHACANDSGTLGHSNLCLYILAVPAGLKGEGAFTASYGERKAGPIMACLVSTQLLPAWNILLSLLLTNWLRGEDASPL